VSEEEQSKKGNHVNELASNPQGEDESVRAAPTDSPPPSDAKSGDESEAPDAADSDDGDDDDGETEAEIEHATFEHLVEDIQDMRASDDQYDAWINVLSKYVKQHVKEEENEMFPDAEAAGVNLAEIGRRLTNRKREMMAGAGDQPVAVPLTARRQA